MADAYRQILDDVKAAVTDLLTTGSAVYEDPGVAVSGSVLPALVVLAREVSSEPLAESPDTDDHLERHLLLVSIASVCQSIAQRDGSALEVKHALLNASRPAERRRYVRSVFEESAEGERLLWIVNQFFELEYHVVATAPDVLV